MIGPWSFYFAQPWWLLACVLVAPAVWLGLRNLNSLSWPRRIAAVALRAAVIAILSALLARPMFSERNEQMTLLAVVDRSQSIPHDVQVASVNYLLKALQNRAPADQLAVVDVAEAASIAKLPGTDIAMEHRSTSLAGQQSYLESGLQMAMAIAPPDTATRILLVSDGNETRGDLKETARIAAANHIPIDVLPLRYRHTHEVVFNRLVAPLRARSGQTVSLRFVLNSTAEARGQLLLTLNGQSVDLDPGSPGVGAAVDLQPGVNVKTVSLPVGTRGMQEFEATFVPDDPRQDEISQNNRASAMTFVTGPGHLLLVDSDRLSGAALAEALRRSGLDVRYTDVPSFPTRLSDLLDTDCIILADTDNGGFTLQQQEMICRYVSDLGGGLIMTGGPHAFGAGGWIGSPVASILPVDLDPPQKQQMPKGALVLIMHACEMPNGNMWGKKTALAAVSALSRLDLVGVMSYQFAGVTGQWVYPLSEAGDKTAVIAAINQMEMGDMPDFGTPVQAAYTALKNSKAGQKHMIIISDGDPAPPSAQLLKQLKAAQITCTGVAYFAHGPNDWQNLAAIAQATGGRFYNVQDPNSLPQIFVKEAQVVRRALIVEEHFTPQISFGLSEIVKGITATPPLDGYVLTGPAGGLNQVVLRSKQGDPVLATGQVGMGRVVAFTSSADARWARPWLSWGGFARFWEQAVRWAGKSASSGDCEIFAEVQDRQVDVTVETTESAGAVTQLSSIGGQIIAPDMSPKELALNQIGPGRYHAQFQAQGSGSYLINVQYVKASSGVKGMIQSAVTVPYAPEFKDLSDNASLLAEVAQTTGGRVLQGDADKVNLFDRKGLLFPQAALPLTRPLAMIWLALFLADVAVRRIALDWKAIGRRLSRLTSVLPGSKGKPADKSLDRLQARRQQVRKQMDERSRELSGRRYEAAGGSAGELPTTPLAPPAPERPPAAAKEQPKAPPAPEDDSHVSRLLQAKRKADGKMRGKDS